MGQVGMLTSADVDGFRLAYGRAGEGPPVVLLHGWPGDRSDYRLLAPMLVEAGRQVVVPDLRGFGDSDKHVADGQYDAAAQGRSVLGLIDELGLERPVLVGYDIGSRIAQAIARTRPDAVGGLVIAPPLPGIGTRVFGERAQAEFWYQPFHKLPVVEELIDGKADAVRDYLRHFWTHWSGPGFEPELDGLVEKYSVPGAFTASINWYRAGAGAVAASVAEVVPEAARRIGVRTAVVWPEFDPLFPREWSDRLDEFFSDVSLRCVDGVGHFAPLEYPEVLVEEVLKLS